MKHVISILIVILILGFSNSKNNGNFLKIIHNNIDTSYTFTGDNGLKVIIKEKGLILEEREYSLYKELILDTLTNVKSEFIPESSYALGGQWIQYYQNGQIKAKGQTKNDFGCWMDSGLFEYYSMQGDLIKSIYYDNWKNDADGCHATVHDITQKEFYNNGKISSEKYFQSGYEEGENNPVGEWKFYNEDGKVTRTEKYKTVYIKK